MRRVGFNLYSIPIPIVSRIEKSLRNRKGNEKPSESEDTTRGVGVKRTTFKLPIFIIKRDCCITSD